jgi:Sulfotransferase family
MRVSASRRLLFVHVPKTGGSSIQHLLDQHIADSTVVLPRHAPLQKALRRSPELIGYWTFGFVRNPWARMVSWWSMVTQRPDDHPGLEKNQLWQQVRGKQEDFEQFVLAAPERHLRLRRPQLSYLVAKGGRHADFIGRTETFATDMRAVLARLELPDAVLPHENASDHTNYREYYTPASRKLVGKLFQPDVRAFGYEF